MRPASLLIAAVFLAVGPLTRNALASPQARLVYSRGAGAETCADEAALRRAVAARIGYDPFFPWATKTVVAIIEARRDHLVGRVELVGNEARSEGARDIESPGTDCGALFDALALTISIAIDPRALAGPVPNSEPPPSEPAHEPSLLSPAPEQLSHARPPENTTSLPAPAAQSAGPDLELSVDGRASFGAEPKLAPGVGRYCHRHVATGSSFAVATNRVRGSPGTRGAVFPALAIFGHRRPALVTATDPINR